MAEVKHEERALRPFTRTSPLTGKTRTLRLPFSEEQEAAWKAGALIQEVAPHLTRDECEFIVSGIAPGEWDEFIPLEH